LTPFELWFGHQPSISHLRLFGCKCFILTCGNSDKFEPFSSVGIFLGYTPHCRSYSILNLETNIVVESCGATFDQTTPCSHDVFESAGDKEMEESTFVYEELQGFKGDEDEHIAPVPTSSPELVPAFTLEVVASQVVTSIGVQVSWIEGEINFENGASSHIQKAHTIQQIIGNLNERVIRSSRPAHLSCFTNTVFVALFEPRDVGHAVFYSS
jgi:hypothetical protein